MKNLFSLLLMIILLCSCIVSCKHTPFSDIPLSPEIEKDSEYIAIQDGSNAAPSVIRESRSTVLGNPSDLHLSTQIVGDRIAYVKTEYENDHHDIAVVSFYDSYGTLMEESPLPTPQDIRNSKQTMLLHTVFLLSDGRWFAVYHEDGNTDVYDMYLMAADGTILQKGILNGTAAVYFKNNRECLETSNGGFRLFLINGSTVWWYDDSLTRQGDISLSSAHLGVCNLHHIDGNRYYYNNGYSLTRGIVDLDSGIEQEADMILNGENYNDKIVYGANGDLYLLTPIGIDRYHEDGSRTEVFSWSEVGIDSNTLDFGEILIMNDCTFLIPQLHWVNGRGITEQILYITSERTISNDVTIILIKGALNDASWLNQAIYAFNRQNPNYFVKYIDITGKTYEELVNETLLYDAQTDMLILPYDGYYSEHYDKGAFLDLSQNVKDMLMPCVYRAEVQEDGSLYTFPTTVAFSAFAAKKGTVADTLTWDVLFDLRNGLVEGEYLIAPQYTGGMDIYVNQNGQMVPLGYQMTDLASSLFAHTLSDFVYADEAKSMFHSDDFRNTVQFLEWIDTHMDVNIGGTQMRSADNRISTGIFPMRLRAGNIRLAEVSISDVRQFTILDMLFGEEDYTLLGYPGIDRDRLPLDSAYNNYFPAVIADTDAADGCLAFVEFLLSDSMQSEDSLPALPVTLSAMRTLLDQNTYQYYLTDRYEQLESGSGAEYVFDTIGTTADYLDDYGLLRDTDALYTVFSFTDEEKADIMDFFAQAELCTAIDRTVQEIVNEELSAWKGGIRTLEETTKIIDGRVWISLNE